VPFRTADLGRLRRASKVRNGSRVTERAAAAKLIKIPSFNYTLKRMPVSNYLFSYKQPINDYKNFTRMTQKSHDLINFSKEIWRKFFKKNRNVSRRFETFWKRPEAPFFSTVWPNDGIFINFGGRLQVRLRFDYSRKIIDLSKNSYLITTSS
jgi:hypothetical protein